MNRIQIIEDDFDIAEGIKNHLNKWGYEVYVTKNLSDITKEFKVYNPDLILLDILLPFYDGFYWCKELRKITNIPIIFISGIEDNMNIVMAMNMGGDDFITKPFDLNVLTAKINAVFRRVNSTNSPIEFIEYNGITLDLEKQSISFENNEVPLTKNEFKILFVLLSNPGKVISREMLMEKLWNSELFIDENTLTVNINRLRKKLEKIDLFDFIITRFGVGYMVK